MKADISVKYFLKSLIPGFIILTVFYLGWKDNQENSRMFYAFIGCIISSITFPFSMKIIQKMVIRFTGKEVWQKDFFTNPVGGSLTVIFELFCFVISVPVVAIYLIFIFCKTLSGKWKGIIICQIPISLLFCSINLSLTSALTAAIIIAKPRIPTRVPGMTENVHAVTDEVALPAASDSSFTKNGRQLSVQTTLPNSVLQSAKSLPSVHRVFSSALFWLMSASWQQKFSFYVKNVICMFLLICSGTDVISRRIYRRFSKGDFIVTATPTRWRKTGERIRVRFFHFVIFTSEPHHLW